MKDFAVYHQFDLGRSLHIHCPDGFGIYEKHYFGNVIKNITGNGKLVTFQISRRTLNQSFVTFDTVSDKCRKHEWSVFVVHF